MMIHCKRCTVKFLNINYHQPISTFLEYARMVHPAQAKMPKSSLNNAIGNVFASEKRKQERNEIDNDTSNEIDDYIEDDEDIEE